MSNVFEVDDYFLRQGKPGRRKLAARDLRFLGNRFIRRVSNAKHHELEQTFAMTRPVHVQERLKGNS